MQNFINFYLMIGEKISTCYYKNYDTLRIAETTSEQIILTGSVLCVISKNGVLTILLSRLFRKLSGYNFIGWTRTEERALRSTLYRPGVLMEPLGITFPCLE